MKVKKSRGDKAVIIIAYCFIFLMAVACICPLIMVVSVSFSSESALNRNGYSILPQDPTLNTYIYLFAHSGFRILRSYGVTIFITVVGTIGAVLMTSMTAFSLSIKSLKYRNVLAFLFNFTIIFSAGLIPWYYLCTQIFGFRNNILGLILPSMFSVFNMFLMRTYFSAVPDSLYESARIDGAGAFRMYWNIAMPLNKTALLTVGMMYALEYWNDWWNALMFIDDRDLFPLQYYLYNILSNVNAIRSGRIPTGAAARIQLPSETIKMAVTLVTIGPIIFLYPFIQKYFVKGIMTGAVKE